MFNRNYAVILRKAAPIAWRWTLPFSKANLLRLARTLGPSIVALGFAGLSSVAHAQGTMDFSGATMLMTTFKTTRLDSDLKGASGLAFSPDGLWLFVAQSQTRASLSCRVLPDGTVDSREPFYDLFAPICADNSGAAAVAMDADGRAYVATRAGVQILDRNGRTIAILPLPGNQPATGLCFAGPHFDTLYVTAGTNIYRRKLNTQGAPPWAEPKKLPPWKAG